MCEAAGRGAVFGLYKREAAFSARRARAISRYEGESSHSEARAITTRIALRISAVRPLLIVDALGRIPFMNDKIPSDAVTIANHNGGTLPLHTSTTKKKMVATPRIMNRKLFKFLMSGS